MTLTRNAVALLAPLPLIACVTSGHDQANSKAAIVGPEWVVEDIAERGVIDDARATILFGNDGSVSGDTSCNRYFAEYTLEGSEIRFRNAGVTKRACAPAIMDQENRFLAVFNAATSYRIDDRTNTLVLSTPAGASITARRSQGVAQTITYRCSDGSAIEARYRTSDGANITYLGQSIEMTTAVSASGSRYVGGGWEWWTKGMNEARLSRLAPEESVASAPGLACTAVDT